MTIYLRKATASQEVPLGQMLSSTDGLTAYTTQIEVTDIHLWKAGATTLAHSSGVSAHISNGVHYITLDDTDTNTAGSLVIFVQPTGALPLREECIVLNSAVYDAWFSSGFLPVDLVNVHGAALTETTTQLAAGISKFFDVATPTSTMNLITAVTTCTTNTDMRGTDSAALATELAKVPKSDSNVTWNATALASINAEVDTALNTAIPVSNTATSVNDILLDVLTIATINATVDTAISDAGLATAAELLKVPKSDSNVTWNATALASINAEVDTALNTAIPASNTANSVNDILLDVSTVTAITDAVWNEVLHTDHEVASSASVLLQAAGGASDPLLNAVPGAYGSGTAGYILGTNLDAPVSTRLAPAGTLAKVTLTDRCTLTDTCTTNTDMRGTNSAALASVCTEGRLAELDAANLPADMDNILTDTGTTLDALIKRVLGLTQENFRISSPIYSVTGKMTSCTMKIYPTATDCTNDTSVLATYTVTATYDVDDNMATYKVVKA